jgi:two-component system, cell cycle response regulator DivK
MAKRILIVEDDPDNRDLIASILGFHGYETIRATNGRQAIDSTNEHLPDLIMMDISMPIINGLEAARHIKENPKTTHIPIVAMSAYDTREDEAAALDAGCVAFLRKPLDLFQLQEQLEEILAKHDEGANKP